ncbi:3805_t:CDS:2 [Diversispora eburnea]|uniref:3805_t:CDS:1 n=1 Tax=Diversispora eburnea TaxID=1213867 RepID=A0A9N8VWC1_9GLOM|nr:3805_t:CDS:2 [Diversispora eburnea]
MYVITDNSDEDDNSKKIMIVMEEASPTKSTSTQSSTALYPPENGQHPINLSKNNKCRSFTDEFKSSRIVEYYEYNRDPKSADWINTSGNRNSYTLANGQLLAHLIKPTKDQGRVNDPAGPYNKNLGQGLTLNSTYKLHFGITEIKMKVNGVGGVVTAFIVNNGDEIDWEMVGKDVNHGQSNFFWNGLLLYGVNGGVHSVPNGPIDTKFHTYTFDWQPDRITWKIDGQVVRTLWRKDTYKDGVYQFPSNPSYVQLGIWDGSGAPGTAKWANGPIDWTKQPDKLTTIIESVSIKCDPKYNIIV